MKLYNTIYVISAVFCWGFHEAAAASKVSLRNGGEKEGKTHSSSAGLPERSLRLEGKDPVKDISENVFGSKGTDGSDKDIPLGDQGTYSKEIYDEADLDGLCPKKLSCRKGLLAVTIKGVCKCLKPCSKVCRNFSIRCNGDYGPGSYWEEYENLRCFQWERRQARQLATFPRTVPISRRFLRTTCKCPDRNYAASDACAPWTQANLSNCIQGKIETDGTYEINFGHLTNVQLGHVHATGNDFDIDFQGDVTGSHFCELESDEGDIEFGGEKCPTHFSSNTVMSAKVGKDFKFEEGAWMTGNYFGTVDAGDDWQFNGSALATRNTVISGNRFYTTVVDDKCNYNSHSVADADIDNNTCDSFTVADDTDCGDVFNGFDCV